MGRRKGVITHSTNTNDLRTVENSEWRSPCSEIRSWFGDFARRIHILHPQSGKETLKLPLAIKMKKIKHNKTNQKPLRAILERRHVEHKRKGRSKVLLGFLTINVKNQFIFPTQAAFLLEVSLFILNLDSTEHNINRTSSPSIKF